MARKSKFRSTSGRKLRPRTKRVGTKIPRKDNRDVFQKRANDYTALEDDPELDEAVRKILDRH